MFIITLGYRKGALFMIEDNLSYYHIFYTVAKEKNISRAAAALYISQPAVSKAIRKLEENTGSTLFLRTSRGVSLTPEGEILFRSVETAMQALSSGEHQLSQMRNLDMGHIRIGVSTTLCKHLLLPYLQTFIHDYPHIRISIFCQSTNQTLKLLEEGNLDIGLIGRPLSEKNITFLPLVEIEDIFVATQTYLDNLKLRRGSERSLFDTATILLLDKENMTRQYIDDYLSVNHIQPKHLLEITTMDLLIDFAKISLGIACVIKNFVHKELENGTLVEVPLNIPIHRREIGFAYSSRMNLSRAAEQFVSAISQASES